jgi:hypothetical protein
MKRAWRVAFVACVVGLVLPACAEDETTDLQVEYLEPVQPNLPEVPQIPPPPHPVTYPDSSYSVYGLRHRIRTTLDTDVSVTGYITEIYEPPPCEQGETCPRPAAPHFWIADSQGETDDMKRLMIVGYAENQDDIEEARRQGARGQERARADGVVPVPIDLAVGNKIKVTGQFSLMSGAGFNSSNGLVQYGGHETLETANPS